jgi:hypothetical protein
MDLATLKVRKKRHRRQRKRKLRVLRHKLAETRGSSERRQLIDKIRRVSPRAPVPDE